MHGHMNLKNLHWC